MVQYLESYKKNIAIAFRNKGFSYSEIRYKIGVPKSTLSYWLKKIKLTEDQLQKLKDRRTKTARTNIQKKITRTSKEVAEVNESSVKAVGKISKRELWLMGIILYQRGRRVGDGATGKNIEHNFRKGVNFMSSDVHEIRLFLKWLEDVGGIKANEILFDIFINKSRKSRIAEVKDYWSKITAFPEDYFVRTYYYRKTKERKAGDGGQDKKVGKVDNSNRQNSYGLLNIRVKASSMLARQIGGWIKGINSGICI